MTASHFFIVAQHGTTVNESVHTLLIIMVFQIVMCCFHEAGLDLSIVALQLYTVIVLRCHCYVCVADQVYGDEDMHSVVRRLCVDYMVFIVFCDYNILLYIGYYKFLLVLLLGQRQYTVFFGVYNCKTFIVVIPQSMLILNPRFFTA